mmetsp:Transcript_7479/g.20952  ORF Transcript_7479/g.20952 Transcript_7479/m.20952 type:complete len:354 (+) Transcript_7479:58-1119(+)
MGHATPTSPKRIPPGRDVVSNLELSHRLFMAAAGEAMHEHGAALIPILRAMPLQLQAPSLHAVEEVRDSLVALCRGRGALEASLRSPRLLADDGLPHDGLPRAMARGPGGAGEAGGGRGREHGHGLLEAIVHTLELNVERQGLAVALDQRREAVRQQAAHKSRALAQGLVEEAEDDEARQHHEQFDIAILDHGSELRGKPLCRLDLVHRVAHGIQQGLGLHVARAQLPRLLPIHEPRDEACVVAEVRVHVLDALSDLPEVAPHRLVGGDDVAGEDARGLAAAAGGRWSDPQLGSGGIQNVATKIVPALALEVRHGVELGDVQHKLLLECCRLGRGRRQLRGRQLGLEGHGSDH